MKNRDIGAPIARVVRTKAPAASFRWPGVLAFAVAALAGGFPVIVHSREPTPFGALAAALATDATWVPAGTLVVPRAFHTATALADGRVLVAGGQATVPGSLTVSPIASAELYDPASGTWTATGSMSTPRIGHTATLLPSGKVLVVGGDAERTGTVEVYDPAVGTWSLTGNLITPRRGHTATLLPDGRVLAAGGYDADALRSAELFDPATGTWSPTGDLIEARYVHTATLLEDGKVLIVRGSNDGDFGSALSSAELYDPATGRFSAIADSGAATVYHTATRLPDGRVLVAGGVALAPFGKEASLASTNVFNPAIGRWSGTGDLGTPRYLHSAVLLPTGEVLVAGGTNETFYSPGGYRFDTLASVELFDSSTEKWRNTTAIRAPRSGHSATRRSDGRILIAGGGIGGPLFVASAELYGDFSIETIVPAFTGSWYDPAQSGHGLHIEVLADNRFLAAWFAFNPAGTEQAWFVGTGTYSGNTATVDVVQPTGGRWIPNFDPSRVVNNPWGTLTFTFTDCHHGRVDFNSTRGYGSGSMNLTRLTQPAALSCSGEGDWDY